MSDAKKNEGWGSHNKPGDKVPEGAAKPHPHAPTIKVAALDLKDPNVLAADVDDLVKQMVGDDAPQDLKDALKNIVTMGKEGKLPDGKVFEAVHGGAVPGEGAGKRLREALAGLKANMSHPDGSCKGCGLKHENYSGPDEAKAALIEFTQRTMAGVGDFVKLSEVGKHTYNTPTHPNMVTQVIEVFDKYQYDAVLGAYNGVVATTSEKNEIELHCVDLRKFDIVPHATH